MIRKIIAINGGGITDVAFLTHMLQLSKYYDKKGTDLLNLFNTFSGVSSGSVIASAFVLREKFLKNIAKYNPEIIVAALNKINSNYSKDEKTDIIKNLKSMTVTNCSSIVIATLIVFFEKERSNIFHRSTLRKIVSINGILFSKYDDNKKNIFNEYFNFKLKDIPQDRTLIIKSINIKKIKIRIYTNYDTSIKNDFIINNANQRISEAIHYSTNAPSYFPYNNMIDGSIILNTSLLEQTLIFKDDDLIIFKLGNITQAVKKNVLFDGIAGWVYPILKIGVIDGYENEILKDLLQFRYQEKFHISEFDLTSYSIDDTRNISKLKNIGRKKSLQSAVTFINRELIVDISKIINTWKDTWNLIKSETKGNMPATIVASEYGILIDYKFTDNKLYVINNVTNGETEIYDWNYDFENTKLLYKNVNDDNYNSEYEYKIIRLNDKELILDDKDGYTYFKKRINYDYINTKIASRWILVKQEKNGKDNTVSLHDNSITVMTITIDFEVEFLILTKNQPVESRGHLFMDVDYGTLTIEQSTSNNNDESSSYKNIVLTIVSFTTNELKLMQKIDNEEVISTYIAQSAPPMRSGLVLTHINPAVRPQDDLYRFMNGKWLTESKIPENRERDGAFSELTEDAEKKVNQIIIDQVNIAGGIGSNAQKIGDLYISFMDENKIEELGITPIAKDLTAAQGFNNKDEFIQLLGELKGGNLFNTYVSTDVKESTKNIMYLSQSGLSLPDEAYYREDKYKEIRDSFLVHVKKMFELAGLKDAQSCATSVLELETQIAAYHWDVVKNRDVDITYNKKSFTQLSDLCPAFNWQLWMKSSETPEHVLTQVVVMQPSYFEGLSKLLENFEVGKWRCWLTWHILYDASPYLNSALVNERFNFYGTTLYGTPKLQERWKRATKFVNKAIGEAVGQIYVERHFGKDAKERIVDMVKNLIHAYRVNIGALDWMSDDTKQKALIKLDKFTTKIGYPDKWRDYSKLSVTPGDLIGNVRAISKYSQDYAYSKIGKDVDKSEWDMTPQTVNAYYNPGTNDIVFPAAILQPPFFDVLADDDAANYGSIGAVIGHEIGHGFDDQGSKYDGDGNIVNWWNDKDRAEFEKRNSKLIKQYDQLSPENFPDIKVNGALTIGENIGDLGGLTIAFKAYEISLNGKEPPIIDGYSGVQRFFMGWAQIWRQKYRPETARILLATDEHSPEEFRCNQIVSNMTEFYDAFAVTQNDKHFMAEDERVQIW